MGTHPIFESDFDCLTEMAETDKPSVLEARLQAARERRQRQEKERADRKTEMASKLEETEKRRQDLVSARDAKIEAKKEHATTRHEEVQKRREVQMRVRREKLLNDVEKTDRLSREAKRRNRHSWGGNIHVEKSQCQMMIRTSSACGDDSPQTDRPRPTALSKPMQNWISGLRSYDGEDGEMSLNTSTHSSLNSPRGQYIVPERLLTPTASSKAKRHTPEGSAATTDDVGKVSEMGDGKLKRRTVSSMDINRLAQPKRSISKDRGAPDGGGSGFGGGLGGGGGGSLTRARSIQNLSPRTKTTNRSRQSSFDNSPRTAPDGAPTNTSNTARARRTSRESGGAKAKTTKTVETPKPKAASTTATTVTKKPTTADKQKTPKPKTTSTPMVNKETPLAKSTPKVQVAKAVAKATVEVAPCDKFPCNKSPEQIATPPPLPSTSDLKKQLELEDLEDDLSDELIVELKIDEVVAPATVEPVKTETPSKTAPPVTTSVPAMVEPVKKDTPTSTAPPVTTSAPAPTQVFDGKNDALESSVDFTNLNLKKVETRSAQSFPIASPTKDFGSDERKPHDQSAGELSIGSSEVVYEEAKGVKTLASKFNELKQESLTSLASESMTSMTSTDTEKEQKGDKSVHWPEDNDMEKVEHISPDEEKEKPEKKKKKKKDKKKSKKEDSDEKSESKKKKKMNSTKNSMIMGWLDNSGETTSEVVNSEIDDVAASSTESVSAPAGAAVGGEGDAKEDEYKRKLEEKKREHQRRKQEQEELEQERLNQLEQQEHDKKKQREAELDAKFEEEKQRMEEKMSENLKKSLEEKEHKRKEEEEQRKARKDRIAAIMKRTREQNNAEQAANNGVSSTPGSELVGLQRTTSSESGTGSVTDMSSRVGSLLGSIRAKTGVVIGEPGQQQDTVNHAVPSVQ